MVKSILPHRLSFLTIKNCDICDDGKNVISIHLNPNKLFGWSCCDKDNCIKLIEAIKKEYSVPHIDLTNRLGDDLFILRSNGQYERNWTIKDDGYYDPRNKEWWVVVKKHDLTKTVSMSDLEEWNLKK